MDKVNHSSFRYERKFFIRDFTIDEVVAAVELHEQFFCEIYTKRFVNNVYFDTEGFSCYQDNVEGKSNRLKVRLRWYGDLFGTVQNPILEIKIKQGHLGKKITLPMRSFVFTDLSDVEEVFKEVATRNPDLPVDLSFFRPTLMNRYSRTYYLSSDQKFRITLDNQQQFYEVDDRRAKELHSIKDTHSTILELKYGTEDDAAARRVAGKLPFQRTRSSKYVRGIDFFHS